MDVEGDAEFTPEKEPGEEVEGHVLDLDIERKR
jgi:hypothetical protein